MSVDDVINVYKQVGEENRDAPTDNNTDNSQPNKRRGDRRGRHRPRRRGPGYSAVCAACGKETEVPFEPTQERQAYCQECYRQVKSASRTKPGVPEAKQPEPQPTNAPAPVEVEQLAIVSPAPALSEGRPEDLGDNRMNADRGWSVEDDPEPKGKRSVVGEFTATPLLHRHDNDTAKNGAPSEHSLRGTNPRRYTSK